jgi:hypothetical protein
MKLAELRDAYGDVGKPDRPAVKLKYDHGSYPDDRADQDEERQPSELVGSVNRQSDDGTCEETAA